MKNLFLILVSVFMLSACNDAGTTKIRLTGNEPSLPAELKGLKVYVVETGRGNWIKVAILPGYTSTSSNYMVGKAQESTILFQSSTKSATYEVSEIISINDSIIVAKLKK